MTTAVQALLETFDALSDAERREAAVEILRRMTPAEGELPEGALLEAADWDRSRIRQRLRSFGE